MRGSKAAAETSCDAVAHRKSDVGTSRLCRGGVSGLDEAGLVGVDDRVHAVAYAELPQHVRDVRFGGRVAYHECLGDLGVRLSAG